MHFKLVPRWKGDSIVWSGRHACHVRLTGKVQGVGFRAWVREQAKQALVGGWVRNCADGSVEVHLEGSRDEVESIVERLRDGPAGARPANVQIEGAGVEYLTRFEVRY
jgi:acylphosphatase